MSGSGPGQTDRPEFVERTGCCKERCQPRRLRRGRHLAGRVPQSKGRLVWSHNREHMPERAAIPGFLGGRRYIALDARPEFFTLYVTESPAVISGPAYAARLNKSRLLRRSGCGMRAASPRVLRQRETDMLPPRNNDRKTRPCRYCGRWARCPAVLLHCPTPSSSPALHRSPGQGRSRSRCESRRRASGCRSGRGPNREWSFPATRP